jgi:hypothetical protein
VATTADGNGRTGSFADVDRRPMPWQAIQVPDAIYRKVTRGRNEMLRHAPQRRLCVRFERGDTFHYLGADNSLQSYDLVTKPTGGGKPPHRIRNRYNFIRPIIEDKVSSATQRVPHFEINPSTTDDEDAAAASLAQKAAIYGYDRWRYRQARKDVVYTAIGRGGVAFAMPYFDSNVGPYREVEGEWIGYGEVKIKTFNGNEVYWEPGVDFDNSRWWVTEQAQPVDTIKELPGYAGGELVPDAATSDIPNDARPDQMRVMVQDYYERPCQQWPRGRHLTMANGRVIIDARLINPTTTAIWRDYPLQDPDGEPIDEPVLHRLEYTHDPDADVDFGLTWQLIDFQRSVQDCLNKMMEYKNRGLKLQMLAPVNSLIDRPDDVPGAVKYYRLSPNGEKPQWEPAPDAQILNGLITIFNKTLEQMQSVGAYLDVQADPNVAARTVGAAVEQTRARWQQFLSDLAEFDSRLMRHCLLLVARYYTEPRLLEIRGRMGWESVPDFRGSKIRHQSNVRVSPGSLEYLSRNQIMAKAQYYASMGWITPQKTMWAIENGQPGTLTETYDLNKARVNRIIQKIRDGTIMEMPTRTEMVPGVPDPITGQVQDVPMEVPAWMPADYDDVRVWKSELGDWLKTDDYERSAPEVQEVGRLMWAGLQEIEAQQAQRAAGEQMAMAQSLGMGNAASPQGPPAPPSQPNVAAAEPARPAPAKAPEDQGR